MAPTEQLLAERFGVRLEKARASLAVDFPWYPYHSLSNAQHLWELLGQDIGAFLHNRAGAGPICDIGCGDGDFAFFLESLGFAVDAVDNPVFNHNGMRGVHALRASLESNVQIASADLDQAIRLPRPSYPVAFLLGVLYHLRNPFLVLDALARCCHHLVISTRVAERFPNVEGSLRGVSAAYLLDSGELNGDNSNYWIFTPAALERLVQRCHWRVDRSIFKGGPRSSPTAAGNDERAFLLLASTYGAMPVELAAGWHPPENEGWRWTQRDFAITFAAPSGRCVVTLQLYVPDALLQHGPLRLTAYCNEIDLGAETFAHEGGHRYSRVVPAERHLQITIHFKLNRALAPDPADSRERGVIVHACSVENL